MLFIYVSQFGQKGLETRSTQNAIELLLTQPVLLDDLRKAHMGNYSVVLSLLGCLENGPMAKKLVDRIIDDCTYSVRKKKGTEIEVMNSLGDHVTNLREDIFINRLKYSLTTSMDEEQREAFLNRAAKALEK